MKSISHYCLLALTIIIFASCQRDVDFPDTERPPTFDSTQLVKSVELIYHDWNGQPSDSITESYSYDTVNRKITVSWESTSPDNYDGSSAVHSYNMQGLLTGITYNYASNYTPWPEDYTTISMSYDNEGILKTVVLNYVASPSVTKNYTKTPSGTGFKLTWENTINDPSWPDLVGKIQTLSFNANGKCTNYENLAIWLDASGNPENKVDFKDSLVYDAAGNLQKVYSLVPGRTPPQPNTQYLAYEFESRHDKGDQLGKQRQLLFRGLDNMQFDEADEWFWTSILTDTPNAYEFDQYTGFPFKTAKVYNIDTNMQVPFTAETTFDSQDRLVTFKGFFNDGPLVPMLYRITYYK